MLPVGLFLLGIEEVEYMDDLEINIFVYQSLPTARLLCRFEVDGFPHLVDDLKSVTICLYLSTRLQDTHTHGEHMYMF